MPNLLSRVLLTLAYTDQFNYPLTAKDAWTRLIGPSASLAAVIKSLDQLVELGLVSCQAGQFCLAKHELGFATRKERLLTSLSKQKQAQHAVRLLRLLPWIEAVYITGSLALNNSPAGGDIDFMVITRPDRLWLCRPMAVLTSLLVGKKRSRHQEKPNSWCFNLWMTTDALRLTCDQRTIFTAYELCQADCIYDRGYTAHRFLIENNWVAKYLPNYYLAKLNQLQQPASPSIRQLARTNWWKSLTLPITRSLGDCLDYVLFKLQLLYMKPHQTRELVNWQKAFFHPRDTQKIVMTNWEKSLS